MDMIFNTFIQLHKQLSLWLYGLTGYSDFWDHIVYLIADRIDNYIVFLAICTLLFFIYQSIEHTAWKRLRFLVIEGFQIFFAIGVSWGLSYGLKQITALPRPYLRYPDEIISLFPYGGFDSFPSGHATLFMALAVMIYLHHKRIGILFIVFALIIGLTRVIAGVHFPIDILVGWFLGGGVSLLVSRHIKHPRYTEFFVRMGKFFS